MAVKPRIVTLTNSSVDVLNAIRNSATTNYREYVPIATADAESIREIGAVIMDMPALQNEFLNGLVNRIGRVMITSRMFSNPWAVFKKGVLDFGETIEDIFVDIAKPFQYDADGAASTVYRREIPNVRSAFYILNYKKFYKATIQQADLKNAFLSWSGVTDLISKIVESMYKGAAYDEFQTMKYLLARHLLDGHFKPITVASATSANAKGITEAIKGESNMMEFPSNKYNIAGVTTDSPKNRQHIIVNAMFDAAMSVEVLAAAFNMDKAEFAGHRHLVDSFGSLDLDRLDVLFDGDDTYVELTSDELAALDAIPAVLIDEDWFVIVDNYTNFTENYNGEGLYWNYFYHVWKTFAASPFANAAAFVPGTPSITSVTVSPETAVATAGQTVALTAEVVSAYFAPLTVEWSSNTEGVTVSPAGIVSIGSDVEAGTEITITVKSTFDSSKSDTATITIPSEEDDGEGGNGDT